MCPEIILLELSQKLATTAVLFINVELLSEFNYLFPRDIDQKFKRLTPQQIEVMVGEDKRVAGHIDLQRRRELLDLALGKIEAIKVLEQSKL